jgi:hypothetical protein
MSRSYRPTWGLSLAATLLMLANAVPCWAGDLRPGRMTAGAGLGIMGGTPDGTAVTLNGHAEQFVNSNLSVGPLAQIAFTGDMFLLGITGQLKYWMDVPDTGHRLKVNFQGGLGVVHADVGSSDTSFLIPLGAGLDYAITPETSLTADFLLNFTNLQNTPQHDAHVMPSITVGLRF